MKINAFIETNFTIDIPEGLSQEEITQYLKGVNLNFDKNSITFGNTELCQWFYPQKED